MDNKFNNFPEYDEYFAVMSQDKSEHTIRAAHGSIDGLLNYLGISDGDDLAKIDYKKILLYRNHLLSNKLNASSINTIVRYIHTFFAYMVEHDYLNVNPVSKVKALKEEKKVKMILTDEECDALVDSCVNDNEKMIIVTLLATGVRRSELVNIQCGDIDENIVLVRFGKGKKQREVPIQPSVAQFIHKNIENRNKTDYLIVSQRGGHQVSAEAVRQTIKKVAKKAGIEPERVENLSAHSFRRKYATSLLSSGVDSMLVQTALGHASPLTTRKYAQTEMKALEKAIVNNQRTILR